MKLSIRHHTAYHYADTVTHSTQYLRLTPRPSHRQKILGWQLDTPDAVAQATDGFGNVLHVLTLDRPHQTIELCARGEVEITDQDREDDDSRLSPLVFCRSTAMTRPDAALTDFAAGFAGPSVLAGLEQLSEAVLARMPFTAGVTHAASTAVEAFAAGAGVCQDHTHVFLSCCREQGIPARYVSGYLYTEDSDHVAGHAWAEVWHDGSWHTFDITNQARRPRHHLKVAVGLDYLDACPVRGVRYGGGDESMEAVALVEKLGDDSVRQQQQ
jgi:transglutaminase-like putative cysteine protease